MTTTQNPAASIIAERPTDELLEMLNTLEGMFKACERGSEAWKTNHTAWLWICEALEARYDVNDAMDAWADSDDGRTYSQALTDCIKAIV
jgi:hypothetical protein